MEEEEEEDTGEDTQTTPEEKIIKSTYIYSDNEMAPALMKQSIMQFN